MSKRKPSSILFDDDDDEREERIPTPSNKRHRSLPRAIRDRIDRALNQRLYLLSANPSNSSSSFRRSYQVLGQTANVYTVEICDTPSCTCPDYANGYICKHIIFILHRVLKVSRQSSLLYQHCLSTDELTALFIHADRYITDQSVLAEESIRQAFEEEEEGSPSKKSKNLVEQKPISADDECPICFESMMNDPQTILFCSRSCGNNMHRICLEKWQSAKQNIGERVTCPFCRAEWKVMEENPDGYRNLAAYATTDDYDDDIVYRRMGRRERRRYRDFYH